MPDKTMYQLIEDNIYKTQNDLLKKVGFTNVIHAGYATSNSWGPEEQWDRFNKEVIDKIDHCNINLDVDFMKGKLASTEVLAVEIWKQLLPHIEKDGVKLHAIKLYETENNFVEYFG